MQLRIPRSDLGLEALAAKPLEAVALREEVDFERRCLRLSDSKTGRRTVPLNAAAGQVLVDIDRDDENPFVIRGSKPGRHL